MNRYAEISTLNHGSYGTVQLVRELRTSRMHAAKRVSLKLSSLPEVEEEIRLHKRVSQFPRVAQLIDHFLDKDANEYVLIVEYCSSGDLHDRVVRGPNLTVVEIKKIILQLLDVLEHCHQASVYHRDVKPENVFLQHNGAIKLGDWGLATEQRLCRDFGTGSELYMAPECFDRSAEVYDAAKADIWACGIVLLNMLFKRTPFKEATERDLLFKDYASSRESLYDIFPDLTRDVFHALRFSLALNPEHRSIAKMREAILAIKHWTTDEEIEEITKKHDSTAVASPQLQVPKPVSASLPRSVGSAMSSSLLASIERSAARAVPVVHKPFRVPTAVARSLHTPTKHWDRRKMFTPPTTPQSPLSSNNFGRSYVGSYKLSMHLPRHLEQPEEEESVPRSTHEHAYPPKFDEDDDEPVQDRPSSPSSTSSTSSTSSNFSFADNHKTHLDGGIFSMDDEISSSEYDPDLEDDFTSAIGPLDGVAPQTRPKVPVYR